MYIAALYAHSENGNTRLVAFPRSTEELQKWTTDLAERNPAAGSFWEEFTVSGTPHKRWLYGVFRGNIENGDPRSFSYDGPVCQGIFASGAEAGLCLDQHLSDPLTRSLPISILPLVPGWKRQEYFVDGIPWPPMVDQHVRYAR